MQVLCGHLHKSLWPMYFKMVVIQYHCLFSKFRCHSQDTCKIASLGLPKRSPVYDMGPKCIPLDT